MTIHKYLEKHNYTQVSDNEYFYLYLDAETNKCIILPKLVDTLKFDDKCEIKLNLALDSTQNLVKNQISEYKSAIHRLEVIYKEKEDKMIQKIEQLEDEKATLYELTKNLSESLKYNKPFYIYNNEPR